MDGSRRAERSVPRTGSDFGSDLQEIHLRPDERQGVRVVRRNEMVSLFVHPAVGMMWGDGRWMMDDIL